MTGMSTRRKKQRMAAISYGPTEPPVNIELPEITGVFEVGQTVTCTPGVWEGADSITFQWLADGVEIPGETNDTLVLTVDYIGQQIDCRVAASNDFGSTPVVAEGEEVVFNPLVNYANGEQGVYYAPWDINTLWQDEERTVPVENYGDPVRVMDDLSPNGNHATAPTSAARGTYGRMPVGGRRNLTVDSENLASGWDYQGSRLNRQFSLNGYQFNEVEITATSGRRRVFMASGRQMTFAGGEAVFSFLLYKGDGYSSLVGVAAWNLGTGESSLLGDVDLDAETASGNCTIEKVYDGVYRCAILGAVPTSQAIGLRLTAPEGKMYVSAIQVEAGGVMTPYQRVGNQYDVIQEGVPDVYYIETDGIDDCYQTAPIDLTMYDSTSLAVGAQNLTVGSTSNMLVELSPAAQNSNPGSYFVVRTGGSTDRPWVARHLGTTTRQVAGTASANNEVNILSMSASISEPDLTAILQGELLNTTASQGTGTLGDYSLNLLSRNTDTNFFQGRFFGAIIVHPRSPYEEQNRQFLAKKAGVTL